MEERFSKLEKEIYGNGQEGLKTKVVRIEERFDSMEKHIKGLSTSYSALAKSQIEYDALEKHRLENRQRLYKLITTSIAIVGVATPITALILKISEIL